MEDAQIRILIAEDGPVYRESLRNLLLSYGAAVREVADAAAIMPVVEEWSPHVVLLDICLPPRAGKRTDLDKPEGLDRVPEIKAHNPTIGIVLMTNYGRYRSAVLGLVRRYKEGIAYLFKDENSIEDIWSKVQWVLQSKVILDSEVNDPDDLQQAYAYLTEDERLIIKYAVSQMGFLTERELEVVERLAASRTPRRIAAEMGLTLNAVRDHKKKIHQKLGLTEVDQSVFNQTTLLCKAHDIWSRYVRDRE